MTLEALPFVNWIFWATLTSGTLLVVGGTELLGGTTRGYRLFMALLLTVCAGILLLSEMSLVSTPEVEATATLRRTLVWAFAAMTGAYLLASIIALPRSGLAIVAGSTGILALAALAAGGATLSAPLFTAQLILSSLALGAVSASMLLGHWYLVTPQLSPEPLRRMMWLLLGTLVLQAFAVALAVIVVSSGPLGGPIGWLTWLRVGAGIILPIGITVLALLASRAASLQASTGLLYVGLALVMAGSIAGASLSFYTGVPV